MRNVMYGNVSGEYVCGIRRLGDWCEHQSEREPRENGEKCQEACVVRRYLYQFIKIKDNIYKTIDQQ